MNKFEDSHGMVPSLSRRGFLQGAGAAMASGMLGWRPIAQLRPGDPRATLAPPTGLPAAIAGYQQAYQNWSGEILVEDVWTVAPRSPEEVLAIVNWAHASGWRVRPKGRSHGWSPLLLPQGASGERYLLLDTTQHLTALSIDPRGQPATVTAQTGVDLDRLVEALGASGLGFGAIPAIGSLTLGGALAINAHGSAIRAQGEQAPPGKCYGSLTNAVLALTAVVWDGDRKEYVLRSFQREDPGIGPLLVHLGRAFITSATLQVGSEVQLRCQSFCDIPAAQLFAPPGAGGADRFEHWVRSHGRAEAIWFPFAPCPWLKVWSVAPERPETAREVQSPYAYTFANWITPNQSAFLKQVVANDYSNTPQFQQWEMVAVQSGLLLTASWDLWGPSRCTSRYVQASTLRMAESGAAIITRASSIQRVVSEFYAAFLDLVNRYREQGLYPVSGPVDIRVSGLDQASEVLRAGAVEPWLSSLRPRADRPGWDCVVWIGALTLPGTPGAAAFFNDLEAWLLGNYTGDYAGFRPEWSKGWGYSPAGPWSSASTLGQAIPAAFTQGQRPEAAWLQALALLDGYDPHRIFSNPFLDTFLP